MMHTTIRPPYLDPGSKLWPSEPASRRALFLDRDGVINVDHGYVHTAAQTDWMPGIFELVAQAREIGLLPVIVTNQAGIARGYYDETAFLAYTAWVHAEFRRRGSPIAATYFCPHHPSAGVSELRCECACRKPQPGMLLAAAQRLDIDLAGSAMVGDKESDIEAARRAGVETAMLVTADDLAPVIERLSSWGRRV